MKKTLTAVLFLFGIAPLTGCSAKIVKTPAIPRFQTIVKTGEIVGIDTYERVMGKERVLNKRTRKVAIRTLKSTQVVLTLWTKNRETVISEVHYHLNYPVPNFKIGQTIKVKLTGDNLIISYKIIKNLR